MSPGSTVNMPKTRSPPRSMKAANAPMKSCIAPKTNIIDVYVTGVPEIAVAIVISRLNCYKGSGAIKTLPTRRFRTVGIGIVPKVL